MIFLILSNDDSQILIISPNVVSLFITIFDLFIISIIYIIPLVVIITSIKLKQKITLK